jgi:hypothetical protein
MSQLNRRNALTAVGALIAGTPAVASIPAQAVRRRRPIRSLQRSNGTRSHGPHCDLKVGKVAISTKWKAAGLAAVIGLAFMGNVARADPCKKILDDFKRLIDNANREISSTLANLQEATRRTPDAKRRDAMVAQNCAASAEALGTFRSYRVVLVACMDERDASRRDVFDKLDRSISEIRASLDKACH